MLNLSLLKVLVNVLREFLLQFPTNINIETEKTKESLFAYDLKKSKLLAKQNESTAG